MKMSKPRDPPLVGFRAGWQPADNDDYGDGGGRPPTPTQAPFQFPFCSPPTTL